MRKARFSVGGEGKSKTENEEIEGKKGRGRKGMRKNSRKEGREGKLHLLFPSLPSDSWIGKSWRS